MKQQKSRISDRTLGDALSKLGSDTLDDTDDDSEGAVGGIPPRPNANLVFGSTVAIISNSEGRNRGLIPLLMGKW